MPRSQGGPAAGPSTGAGSRSSRPDASMDLLRQIVSEAVDPDYARAAAPGRRPRSRPWGLVGVLVTCALLAAAISQHAHGEPSDQAQRVKLAQQVTVLQAEIQTKKAEVRSLDSTISTLQAEQLSSSENAQLQQAQVAAGATALTGPGVMVTCDDSPQARSDNQRVADGDLRVLVNGLWEAGAEAISINGQRITATSAIRSAGSAITVNYTSLTPPYRLVALGDRASIPGKLASGQAGAWWSYLHTNYGLVWTVATAKDLSVPASTVVTLTQATARR